MANLFLGFPVPRAKIATMIEEAAPPIAHAPWHLPDGSDPLSLPADISAGQALGWDGTKYKGYDVGGAAAPDLLTNFFFQTFFESLDAIYQVKTGTGAITLYDYAVYLNTGASGNSQARIYKRCSVPTPGLTWSKKRTLQTRVSLTQSAGGDLEAYIWTGYPINKSGFGFYIEANCVYGQSGDGSFISSIALETIPPGGYSWSKHLKAVFTPASKVEFYLDNIKVGEKTNNLPTALTETYFLMYFNLKNIVAANEQAYISMWKVFQEA